jgi:uncharacterized protein YbjT (DUF2867 family)
MKVIIAGSTGMIGDLILWNCIRSNEVTEIVTLDRKAKDPNVNKKVTKVPVENFNTYDERTDLFAKVDLAFFCVGVYTGQVKDPLFKEITVDYAVHFAEMLKANSPKARLCLLSGAGADRSEKSRTAFARYKGMAENRIAKLGLDFYTFRPSYIYPVTPRKEPNLTYKAMRLFYPLIRLLGENMSIKSTELAQAMYHVGMKGAEKEILENKDIIKELNNATNSMNL